MPFPSLTLEQLQTACAEWQKRLRLQDWDIDIEIKRYHDMDTQGLCRVSQELRHAQISILDALDGEEGSSATLDMESILLHEMLHIPFDLTIGKDRATVKVKPREETTDINWREIALEQAFCGLVPWMMSVGRVIPLEVKQ